MNIRYGLAGLSMVVLGLAGADANAGYSCKSYDGKSSLSLYDDYGLKVLLENEKGGESLFYALQASNDDSSVYSQKTFHLHSPKQPSDEATLTMASHSQYCGRGSCDVSGPKIINAKLKYHDIESNFSCVETDL